MIMQSAPMCWHSLRISPTDLTPLDIHTSSLFSSVLAFWNRSFSSPRKALPCRIRFIIIPDCRDTSRSYICLFVISRLYSSTRLPWIPIFVSICVTKADFPTAGRAPMTMISPPSRPPRQSSNRGNPV